MKKILSVIGIALYTFLIYLILAGSLNGQEIITGAFVSAVIALLVQSFFQLEARYLNPVRIFWLIVYLPVFIWAMMKANFEMALIILNPKLKLSPIIVKGKTTLSSPLGKTLLANSITLTPGTLTVDVDGDKFAIHCVRNVYKNGEEIMQVFEKFIKRITE
ncbi:MAG TPA: Na+/H+ antiporter subunit E [Spirochaetia bacterium]|nr:MAG: hypothetical protein A2Y41_11950 [Spirochaetes bacterium GWB1_36_13]HCL58180.1 Na+/H+ antiporter subunit E [Spirochaetia bacterium]